MKTMLMIIGCIALLLVGLVLLVEIKNKGK